MLTLENFEDEMDSIILSRGYSYFKGGKIIRLKDEDGDVTAIVSGTNEYQVKTKIAGKGIIDSQCSCPYEGDYCKHEIAVFYALSRGVKTVGKNTNDNDLDKLSKSELLNLVKLEMDEDTDFMQIVETENLLRNSKNDKDEYKKVIRESVNSAKDRHGFIDWDRSRQAVRGSERLLDRAENMLKKDIKAAISIYQAVIEVLVPTLQLADDSDGSLGESIEYSFEALEKISTKIKNDILKTDLFEYCLCESTKQKYTGWDYAVRFLAIAGNVCNATNKDKLFKKIDVYLKAKDDNLKDYYSEEATKIKYKIILKIDGEKEASVFAYDNLQYDNMRQILIAKAVDNRNFIKAKKLSKEGVEKYSAKYPGLKQQYLELLLQIAELENDKPTEKDLLCQLFIEDNHKDYQFYNKLKQICTSREWQGFLQKIISKIDNTYDLAQVYAKENMTEELIKLIKGSDSPHLAEEYFNKLFKKYPRELADVYERVIVEELKNAQGRSVYQEVCKYLERIIFLGFSQRVEVLIRDMVGKYPNRRAMIEEFGRIKFN